MAEYLAVDYNGLFNSYKLNTEYLEAPIVATKPLTEEQATAQAEADRLAQEAVTAETAVNEALLALSLASGDDLVTAQLALDEAVRLAQEAQAKAEEAQA